MDFIEFALKIFLSVQLGTPRAEILSAPLKVLEPKNVRKNSPRINKGPSKRSDHATYWSLHIGAFRSSLFPAVPRSSSRGMHASREPRTPEPAPCHSLLPSMNDAA